MSGASKARYCNAANPAITRQRWRITCFTEASALARIYAQKTQIFFSWGPVYGIKRRVFDVVPYGVEKFAVNIN